jgi:hypothetical protein
MKKIIISLLLVASCAFVNAQIKVSIGSAYEQEPGSSISLPVKIEGVDAAPGGIPITGMEFHILYENNKLVYDTTLNFSAFAPKNEWFFGASSVQYGTNWLEPNGLPLSFPDSTILFEVVFDYLGGTTDLIFDTIACLILDANFATIPGVQYVNGHITPSQGSGISRWKGTGPWTTTANWSNGIPGDSTEAIIETGTVNIFSNAVTKKMTINSGSICTLEPDFSLTVHHEFTNEGTFHLKSDTSGSGSVIVGGNVAGTGAYQIERHLDFSAGFPHLVSTPVNDVTAAVFNGLLTEKYSESASVWTALIPSDILQPGFGYRVSGANSATIVFSGLFNTTDVIPDNILYTSSLSPVLRGLNCVGNPYPSAIQWTQGDWTKTHLDASIYIWDGYKYVNWNGTIGSLTDGIIPQMQGFFIKANGQGAGLKIPASSRIHSNQPFYKNSEELENVLVMKLEKTDDALHYDEAYVNILTGSTGGFDSQFDAYKLYGNPLFPELFTLGSDDSELSINTQPDYQQIPVEFHTSGPGSYKITFTGIETFEPSQPLYFEDKKAGVVINIRNINPFVFNSDSTPETGRLILYFQTIGIAENQAAPLNIWIADHILYIHSTSQQASVRQIDLYNPAGQRLFSEQEPVVPAVIKLNESFYGLYIVRISTNNGIYTKKIIIQ